MLEAGFRVDENTSKIGWGQSGMGLKLSTCCVIFGGALETFRANGVI